MVRWYLVIRGWKGRGTEKEEGVLIQEGVLWYDHAFRLREVRLHKFPMSKDTVSDKR